MMSDQAERLRQITRQNNTAANAGKEKPCRVVTVSSGKGGVGKTNLVVNMGLVLARWNYRVVIIDADLGLANVDVLINAMPRYTLVDVINGTKSIHDVIHTGPYDLMILPGGSGFSSMANLDKDSRDRLIARLRTLENEGDIMFLDTGAGISRNVLSFIGAADEFIIITTPEPTALTDAYGMIKVVFENGYKNEAFVVVNFARHHQQGQEIFSRLSKVTSRYLPGMKLHYLGGITYDPAVAKSVEDCKPFVMSYPKSGAAASIEKISRRFLHQEPDAGEDKGGFKGFLHRFARLIKQ